ncbi:acyl-CoA desaturase [Caerostris extrusa]|uniref:Acyl-CoA desaturase n=1 Tax=Caerostris extrusa TaxID=172846 RepID=A0AAV4S0J7_CAEEX|nr:acyl-CoA desaturase [Caerostris extrusa]
MAPKNFSILICSLILFLLKNAFLITSVVLKEGLAAEYETFATKPILFCDEKTLAEVFFDENGEMVHCRLHELEEASDADVIIKGVLRSPVCPVLFRHPGRHSVLLLGEKGMVKIFGAGFFRYVICLHFTWCVNSLAHMWGNKPYDKNISAVETKWVSAFAIGEGFHNYHHTFPWDYATSELGYKYNFTTLFIDCMAYLGQAYDL